MTARMPVIVAIALAVLLMAGTAVALANAGRVVPIGAPAGDALPLPVAGPGSSSVQLSADATEHRFGVLVRDQLQGHYQAINARDYASWQDTVVPERWALQPEPRWQADYASTTDGSIRVDRIDDLPDGGLLVRVRFVSTQAPADAPPDLPADRLCWYTSVPMTAPTPDGPPRIGRSGPGSSRPEVC